VLTVHHRDILREQWASLNPESKTEGKIKGWIHGAVIWATGLRKGRIREPA
jgi:hypothetical protein